MDLLGLFFIFIFVVFILSLSVLQKKRYARFVQFVDGKLSWFGTISFEIQHLKFQISNVGTGNMNTGMGGSYHKLKLEIGNNPKLFLGPLSAYKYVSAGKVPDYFQKFAILEKVLIAHFETKEKTELLRKCIFHNQELQIALVGLIKKDFQYLRSSSTFVVEKFQLKKKFYFELSFIEHSCMENFDELQALLKQFRLIAEHLKQGAILVF